MEGGGGGGLRRQTHTESPPSFEIHFFSPSLIYLQAFNELCRDEVLQAFFVMSALTPFVLPSGILLVPRPLCSSTFVHFPSLLERDTPT